MKMKFKSNFIHLAIIYICCGLFEIRNIHGQQQNHNVHGIKTYQKAKHFEDVIRPKSVDFKADDYDYYVKLLPQKEECPIEREISVAYDSEVKVARGMNVTDDDLLKCEVVNANYKPTKEPLFEISTIGSLSDPGGVTKFRKPTNEDCFSFRVRCSGVAKIFLLTNLNLYKYIIVTLGSSNNTQSFISDNHALCKECHAVNTPNVLHDSEFRGFWIYWKNDEVIVGKEDSNEVLFSNTFYEDVGKIIYIGIATPGHHSGHGTWQIEAPFCPETLKKPKTEHLITTKCHKIFDNSFLNSKKITEYRKLFKRVEALILEYETELLKSKITPIKIDEYYDININRLYYTEYLTLYKKCNYGDCKEVLKATETKIENFQNVLKNKAKNFVEGPVCSEYANFNEYSNKCKCKSGYAGNGMYCKYDSDNDGIPDEAISECENEDNECKKDNCPNDRNPYQEDSDYNGIGDACEEPEPKPEPEREPGADDLNGSMESSNEDYLTDQSQEMQNDGKNCANLRIPAFGKQCKIQSDFKISSDNNDDSIELTFIPYKEKDKFFRLTWNNKKRPTFMINKLKNEDEQSNDFSGTFFKPSNLLWKRNSPYKFQRGETYSLIIEYSIGKIKLRLEGKHEGETKDFMRTFTLNSEMNDNTKFTKLCSESKLIKWLSAYQDCE